MMELCLVNPPFTSSLKNIRKRSEYFCEMFEYEKGFRWSIIPRNGKVILGSSLYKNKAQCRNVGKKFASMCGLEWRE